MPTPLPWITDRPPTEADGDKDGDVIALLPDKKSWCAHHWTVVELGQAWLPFTLPTAAPSTPEPTPSTRTPLTRRIVSITRTIHGATETIDAIADDGTAWWMVPGEVDWTQLPALPKQEADRATGMVP